MGFESKPDNIVLHSYKEAINNIRAGGAAYCVGSPDTEILYLDLLGEFIVQGRMASYNLSYARQMGSKIVSDFTIKNKIWILILPDVWKEQQRQWEQWRAEQLKMLLERTTEQPTPTAKEMSRNTLRSYIKRRLHILKQQQQVAPSRPWWRRLLLRMSNI